LKLGGVSNVAEMARSLAELNLSSARASATDRMLSPAAGARTARQSPPKAALGGAKHFVDRDGPDAWYPSLDAETGQPFWTSRRTGESVWDIPSDAWECHFDARTQHEFIWNPTTGARAWVLDSEDVASSDAASPAGSIEEEEEQGGGAPHARLSATSEWIEFEEKGTGKLYYFHPSHGTVQWAPPASGVARTADGREAVPRAIRLTVSAIRPRASAPTPTAAAMLPRRSSFVVDVASTAKLADVKIAICAQGPEWVPRAHEQMVALRGQLYEDAGITLGQMQVPDSATLHLINWGAPMLGHLDSLCRAAVLAAEAAQ
jgi:hypothetical protein